MSRCFEKNILNSVFFLLFSLKILSFLLYSVYICVILILEVNLMDEKSLKLKNIIKSQYKSIRAFADKVGIPNTTLVTALNNGIGGMAVEKVILICECLNIDVKTFEPISDSESFSFLEKEIIKKYRQLDADGKERVDYVLNLEYKLAADRAENKEELLG